MEKHDIKNPSGKLSVNGASFNEFWVANQKVDDFVKWGKETFKGSNFFGQRDDKEQTEQLREVHKLALEMTAPKEKADEPAKGKTALKADEGK